MIDVGDLIDAFSKEEFYTNILFPFIAQENTKFEKLEEERHRILTECSNEEWAARRLLEETLPDEDEIKEVIRQLDKTRKKIDPAKLKKFKF